MAISTGEGFLLEGWMWRECAGLFQASCVVGSTHPVQG